jgi:hypothetical protein
MSTYGYRYGGYDDDYPAFQPEPVDDGLPPMTVHEFNEIVERAIERGNHPGRNQRHKKPKNREERNAFYCH